MKWLFKLVFSLNWLKDESCMKIHSDHPFCTAFTLHFGFNVIVPAQCNMFNTIRIKAHKRSCKLWREANSSYSKADIISVTERRGFTAASHPPLHRCIGSRGNSNINSLPVQMHGCVLNSVGHLSDIQANLHSKCFPHLKQNFQMPSTTAPLFKLTFLCAYFTPKTRCAHQLQRTLRTPVLRLQQLPSVKQCLSLPSTMKSAFVLKRWKPSSLVSRIAVRQFRPCLWGA